MMRDRDGLGGVLQDDRKKINRVKSKYSKLNHPNLGIQLIPSNLLLPSTSSRSEWNTLKMSTGELTILAYIMKLTRS